MKRIMTTLAVMVMLITSAAAMSYSKARREARFLTDKMAYELSLSTSQMDAVYEINLDYLLALNSPLDLDGIYWMRRNSDLRFVLSYWQWELYTQILDFYRPMYWVSGTRFSLYVRNRYTHRHDYFFGRPSIYGSYRGGHNSGHVSFYANRNYGAPTPPPSIPNNHGTHRSGSGNGNPGYTIGGRSGYTAGGNQAHNPGGNPGNVNPGGNHQGNPGGNHQGHVNPGGNHQGNVNPGGNPGNRQGNVNSGSNRGNASTGSNRGNANPNTGRATVTNEGRNNTVPSTATSGRSAGGGSATTSSSNSRGNSSSSSRSGSVNSGSSSSRSGSVNNSSSSSRSGSVNSGSSSTRGSGSTSSSTSRSNSGSTSRSGSNRGGR